MADITADPEILHGDPVIAGTRIPVYAILDLVANGYTPERITKEVYPDLTKVQIHAALRYAAAALKNEEVLPLASR